jgi:uncharacterized protein (TIGR02996 family)
MTEQQLLRAIHDAPDDDAPRLVYADWLQQHGDPGRRGEFIALQFAAQKDPGLWKRVNEIPKTGWLPALGGEENKLSWSRGFPSSWSTDADTFLAAGERVFAAAPTIRHLELHFSSWGAPRAADVAERPELARLAGLVVRGAALGDDHLVTLTGSRHLRRLTSLTLLEQGLGDDGLARLVNFVGCRGLTGLNLYGNRITSEGVKFIAGFHPFRALAFLGLARMPGIGAAGARALAESTRLKRLRDLHLDGCPIGDEGARALLGLPLRSLSIHDVELSRRTLAALSARISEVLR